MHLKEEKEKFENFHIDDFTASRTRLARAMNCLLPEEVYFLFAFIYILHFIFHTKYLAEEFIFYLIIY